MTWRASDQTKYVCKVPSGWNPKRRRLRHPPVRASVKTFRAVAEEVGFWIDELTVEHNPLHMFLGFPRKYAVARVAGALKSTSVSRAFDRSAELRRKCWSGDLCDDGYAARTMGDRVTTALIRRYINPGTDEQASKQSEFS